MHGQFKRVDVEAAKQDLQNRTLAQFGYDFARLIYLSSLRDFSTGEYHHHGLAHSFSEPAASAALTISHQQVFYDLTAAPLESLVAQVERFIRSSSKDCEQILSAWERLEAYRVTVPSDCDELTVALFRSNVKIAMALLKAPRSTQEEKHRPASPRLLLDQ
jgi:hypothetical protein